MPKNGETGLSTRATHKAIRQSDSNCWSTLRDCFEIRSGESNGGGFENRSAADIWVREHRKRRERHQMAARVEFPNGLLAVASARDSSLAGVHIDEPYRGRQSADTMAHR